MNKDLEATLAELGPEYRGVVDRLRGAYEPTDARLWREERPSSTGRITRWTAAYLVAASIVILLGLAFVFRGEEPARVYTARSADPMVVYTLAYREGVEATDAILASQKADGSWSNDFLTRQNAAALRDVAEAKVAYKRAVRYLQSKGLSPLTEGELKLRGDWAARCRL